MAKARSAVAEPPAPPITIGVSHELKPGQEIAWEPQPRQRLFLESPAFEGLYGGALGGGKALCCDTPIPTPSGWTRMGDLGIGDTVFDEHGKPCTVMAVSGWMNDRPCYRVDFSDGSFIVADEEHQWLTFDKSERVALVKRTPEYRAARAAVRPSRVSFKKSAKFSASLSARNATTLRPPTKAPPVGAIRTTREIAATLRGANGRETNHTTNVCGALELPTSTLPLDPYVLGVWLGDGTSASTGVACHDDDSATIDEIRKAGYEVKKWAGIYAWGIQGITHILRDLGVLNNKHIPQAYLRASREQRIALLQGLLDTDGWADLDGQANFCACDRRLARQVHELIVSLGIRATLRAKRAKINGRVVNVAWNIGFRASFPVFRLARKVARQKLDATVRTKVRYITGVTAVPSRPVQCIAVSSPSQLFLAGRSMIPTHNSQALLWGTTRFVDCADYRALILRKTFPELRELMDEAIAIFPSMGAKWIASEKRFVFPSGATIEFGYGETYSEVLQYRGQQYQHIAYDEIGDVADERVWTFLLTRLRSGKNPNLVKMARCSANPGGAGAPWLKRRFISVCDPNGALYVDPKTGNTRCFVQSKLADNKALTDADPDYATRLLLLSKVEREQLLEGNWDVGSGLAFESLSEDSHITTRVKVPDWARCFGGFDWGFGHRWSFSIAYLKPGGMLHVVDSCGGRKETPHVIVSKAKDLLVSRGLSFQRLEYTVAGSDVKIRDEARGANGPSIAEQLGSAGWWMMNADQSRVAGYQNLLRYIDLHLIEWEDTPGNRFVIKTLRNMVTDPDNPNDVLKQDANPLTGEGGDDEYDQTRYLAMSRPLESVRPVEPSALEERVKSYLTPTPRPDPRAVTMPALYAPRETRSISL